MNGLTKKKKTMKETINFVSSKITPNCKEVQYWIDLQSDPYGRVIKTWTGSEWSTITDSDLLNKIEAELENKANKATTLSGYGITDAYTKTQVDSKVASVYRVKGSVANFDALPTTAVVGDVYNLTDTGANYVCIVANPAEWDKLSETVDLSHCVASDDISNVVAMTQAEYEALQTKDSKTLYLIHE